MATIPVNCPWCKTWIRVAAQPSRIARGQGRLDQLIVQFSDQVVAHICKEE